MRCGVYGDLYKNPDFVMLQSWFGCLFFWEETNEEMESELTPAQVFYMENRERLVSRAQDYYLEKHRESHDWILTGETCDWTSLFVFKLKK